MNSSSWKQAKLRNSQEQNPQKYSQQSLNKIVEYKKKPVNEAILEDANSTSGFVSSDKPEKSSKI